MSGGTAEVQELSPLPVTSQVSVILCFSFTFMSSNVFSPTMRGGTKKKLNAEKTEKVSNNSSRQIVILQASVFMFL